MSGRVGVRRWAVGALLLVGQGCEPAREHVLVVYTAMPAEVVEAVEDGFEATHVDVDVRMVALSGADALARLRVEKGSSQADVWWGARPRDLAAAEEEGLLGDSAPAWRPAAESSFVFAFHREHASRSRLPRDWVDLFHPRWAGEVVLPDPIRDGDTAFLLGAWIAREQARTGDLQAGFDWLLRLDEAVSGYEVDLDHLLDRLKAGEASVGVVPKAAFIQSRAGRSDGFEYLVPESGSPVLVRGVALLTGSVSRQQAEQFLEYLGSPDARAALDAGGFRFRGVQGEDAPDSTGTAEEDDFRAWQVDSDYLMANLDGWIERWRASVRGVGARLP